VVAIVNPLSGRGSRWPDVRRISRILEDAGVRFETWSTKGPGHATELAAQAAGRGESAKACDAVLIVGGDGTVCEVVNGLVGTGLPMAILGAGTENLLVRELVMPADPHAIAETLLYGDPFRCDVGEVNGRFFLAIVGAGFDAECVQRLTNVRSGHIGYADYFWPIWRTFWAHRFPWMWVVADGQDVFRGRGMVFIGGIGRYAGGLRILARARMDDGLLDLAIFPCAGKGRLLRHAMNTFLARHLEDHSVVYRQCRRIQVGSPERVLLEIDGEAGGFLPIDCHVVPRGVVFLRRVTELNPQRRH
jgi:diacylglycerol kinase family enzyme